MIQQVNSTNHMEATQMQMISGMWPMGAEGVQHEH
jgi:hypothetical protein